MASMHETNPLEGFPWIFRIQNMNITTFGALGRPFTMRVHLVEHHLSQASAGHDDVHTNATLQALLDQMDAFEALVPGHPPRAKT
jgi:hypothetical protein